MRIPIIVSLMTLVIVFNLGFSRRSIREQDVAQPAVSGSVLGQQERAGGIESVPVPNQELVVDATPSASAFPVKPILKDDMSQPSDLPPRAAVLDVSSGEIIFSYQADKPASIASLSKLMTALVFLDAMPSLDWDKYYPVDDGARREGGRNLLYLGDEVKLSDIFNLCLVASENTSAMMLVKATGLSEKDFVAKMNTKASDLGLTETRFRDPVGLHDGNISTAAEVARLTAYAMGDEHVRQAVAIKSFSFQTKTGTTRRAVSTDKLLSMEMPGIKLLGGKTGFTNRAGYCFSGLFESGGRQVVAVALGTEGETARFTHAKNLADWSFSNFSWQ
jgi:D-alanyl-D-alanine carboxypeptidase